MGPDVWQDADADVINAPLQRYITTSLSDSPRSVPSSPPSVPIYDNSTVASHTSLQAQCDSSGSDTEQDDSSSSENDYNDSSSSITDEPQDPSHRRTMARKRKRHQQKYQRRRQRHHEIRQLHAQEIAYLHSYDPSQFPVNEQLVQELSIAEATVSAAAFPPWSDIDMGAQVPSDNEALCPSRSTSVVRQPMSFACYSSKPPRINDFLPVKMSCPRCFRCPRRTCPRQPLPHGSYPLRSSRTLKRPVATPPRLVPTQVFTDTGASCSVIHADLVKKLNLLTIRSTHGVCLVDVNKRLTEHHTLAYVQLSFPDISYRQILLCVVMEHTPNQLLLGSKDQKELEIPHSPTVHWSQ